MDRMSAIKRSKIMAAIRSKNTKPELALRKALWLKGYRYRIHYGEEKIDISFPKKKIAIFVDGCFWHACPIHSHYPKTNKNYWSAKLKRNVERDKAKAAKLSSDGWIVIRVWEHELSTKDSIDAVIVNFESVHKTR